MKTIEETPHQKHPKRKDDVKSETLTLRKTLRGLCLLDSRKNLIGWFNTESEAKSWCDANGYNMRVQS